MPEPLTGSLDASNLRFAIVASRFNDMVTNRLVEGAVALLRQKGAKPDAVTLISVPGAWEIPHAAQQAALTGKFAAVIALGCVIRGETAHFEYVAGQAVAGLTQVALQTQVPVTLGVLTTENLQQALDRAGGKAGNKGAEAAEAAIEMANLKARIRAL